MGETAIVVASPVQIAPASRVLSQEEQLIEMWLHGLSRHTQRGYRRAWKVFREQVTTSIERVTLGELQAFSEHLKTLSLRPGSRHSMLAAVKSFFAYAHSLGVLPFDVGHPLRMPASKDTLNERILEEEQVRALIAAAGESSNGARDKLIVETLYVAGVRVSELTALCWRDLKPRRDGGQITMLGKGNKTRTVLLPADLFADLLARRGGADDGKVFGISSSQVERVVAAAAKRAKIGLPVSPHWLRHCHCSHALDNGAPIHLVQATVGHASVATTSRYLHARPAESSSSFVSRGGRTK